MKRALEQYASCSPDAIASGSKAQMIYFVEDAKADIAVLHEALEKLNRAAVEVSRIGAATGPQWTKLTIAILGAKSALAKSLADTSREAV